MATHAPTTADTAASINLGAPPAGKSWIPGTVHWSLTRDPERICTLVITANGTPVYTGYIQRGGMGVVPLPTQFASTVDATMVATVSAPGAGIFATINIPLPTSV